MSESIIQVEFIDVQTRQRIAGGNLPASQLPETFAKNTVMHIGEDSYQVVKAEPVTAEEFIKSGSLKLTVAKVEYMTTDGILYSLPTICDGIASTSDVTAPEANVFTLHEDDWRQIEFISASHTESINAELLSIVSIYNNHQAEGGGFRELHVRRLITAPLKTKITLDDITSFLPDTIQMANALTYNDDDMEIANAFAIRIDPLVIYGHLTDTWIDTLGIQFIDNPANITPALINSLVELMKADDLVFVDWVRVQVVPPSADGLQTYFSKFGG